MELKKGVKFFSTSCCCQDIYQTIFNRHHECLQWHISEYADVNDTMNCTFDPLICLATEYNLIEFVQTLLKYGADIESRCMITGHTPLLLAAEEGYVHIAKYLIDSGCNINATANNGSTALMKACYHGYNTLVEILIRAGADLNMKNKSNWTAAMCAVLNNQPECLDLLVCNNADISLEDNCGNNCLDLSDILGTSECREILHDRGEV